MDLGDVIFWSSDLSDLDVVVVVNDDYFFLCYEFVVY